MRRLTAWVAALAVAVLSAACERTPETATVAPPAAPVVVYVAFEDDAAVRRQLERYTDATGVPVIVRRGVATDIVDDIIENTVIPAADILMTQSVTGVWRAAEEGALRPVASELVVARTPSWTRDADKLWAATGFTAAAIITGAKNEVDDATTFAVLAEPRFKGELCLSSSDLQINRALIVMLIDELGVRPAEIVVRGWLQNLAVPVFTSEEQVLEAIHAGTCIIGIASASVAAQSGLLVHVPQPAAVEIDGIGIGRHAHNPDGALALVEWLIAELPASTFDSIDTAGQKNVGVIAWYQRDAALLAERARYR
jgi:iron(III) transport system substrate-binding protein